VDGVAGVVDGDSGVVVVGGGGIGVGVKFVELCDRAAPDSEGEVGLPCPLDVPVAGVSLPVP